MDNCRLFVGGIPKTKKREEIVSEMRKVTDGVVDVIVYPSAADKSKNRGFAFVEYESHRAAAMARRKLLPGEEQRSGRGGGDGRREIKAAAMLAPVKRLLTRFTCSDKINNPDLLFLSPPNIGVVI